MDARKLLSGLDKVGESPGGTGIALERSPWSHRKLAAPEIRNMFDVLASRYDLLNDLLSLGHHRSWKIKLVSQIPLRSRHLDLCCGTGDIIGRAVRKRKTRSIGLDFSAAMIASAQKSYPSLEFVVGDATALPFDDSSFDAITISFGIRNIPNIAQCLAESFRVLKEGGKIFILEFGKPHGIFSSFFNWYGKKVLPAIGARISGHTFAYDYLQETQAAFPCGAAFESFLLKAHFNQTTYQPLNAGLVYLYTGTK